MTLSRRLALVALALVLVGLTFATYRFRRSFIQAFFVPSTGGAAAPLLAAPPASAASAALPPVQRVRVVLIDGLGKSSAQGLPSYDALCRDGLDFTLDTGFPTVSLPVQHALWTGLTQQQSGILFRGKGEIEKYPLPPPAAGIPAQVPDSMVVAESHQYIVHALGFAETLPELGPKNGGTVPEGWAEGVFVQAARDAVASERSLVFVHILRVDVAGHKSGRDSAAYQEAARTADAILGELVAAERAFHGAGTRWFVLADHGHRGKRGRAPAGGHGGEEPHIRQVRACVADTGLAAAIGPRTGYVHLIDLSRAIADSLSVRLGPEAAGRPLAHALAAVVQPDATLPRPGPVRWLVAAFLLLIGLASSVLAAAGPAAPEAPRRSGLGIRWWWRLPWWWPVALAAIVAFEGVPSLSMPMVYAPRGKDVYMTALPGLLVLAVLAGLAVRQQFGQHCGLHSGFRLAVAQLALPVLALLAALVLAGGLHVLVGAAGEPPLMPLWTAQVSVLAVLVFTGALVCALAVLVSAVLPRARTGHDRP